MNFFGYIYCLLYVLDFKNPYTGAKVLSMIIVSTVSMVKNRRKRFRAFAQPGKGLSQRVL